VWSDKVLVRFKDRIRQITSRRRGISMPSRIEELRRYAVGWLNYFGISHTYTQVLELDQWIRRRVRMCFWKQWQRPRTRRRHLLALGVRPEEVHLATRCRRGYWWMSGNGMGSGTPVPAGLCPCACGASLSPRPAARVCSEPCTTSGSNNRECRTRGNDGSICITSSRTPTGTLPPLI